VLPAIEGGRNAGRRVGIKVLPDAVLVLKGLGRVAFEIEPVIADLRAEASLERIFAAESLMAETFADGRISTGSEAAGAGIASFVGYESKSESATSESEAFGVSVALLECSGGAFKLGLTAGGLGSRFLLTEIFDGAASGAVAAAVLGPGFLGGGALGGATGPGTLSCTRDGLVAIQETLSFAR